MTTTSIDLIREAENKAIYVSPVYGLLVKKDGQMETIYPVTTKKVFYSNSGVLSWCNAVGQYFIPISVYGDDLRNALKENGYECSNFWIALCNDGIPVDMEERWRVLWNEAYRQQQICRIQYLNEHTNVKPLPNFFISDYCFEVPLNGISVKSFPNGKIETLRPEFLSECNFKTPMTLGKFSTNLELIAFYNENGNYFICKNTDGNRNLLCEHGYTEGFFPVMFSNGDRPNDEILLHKLEKIL